jgi:hypothetical protein
MNENCCNICENPPTEKEITPDGSCEDLRVDCLHLVKRRYCLLSPKFSKEFCSKSCGFCPPLEKEIVDKNEITYPHVLQTTQSPTTITTATTTQVPQTTTLAQLLCRDKNFK